MDLRILTLKKHLYQCLFQMESMSHVMDFDLLDFTPYNNNNVVSKYFFFGPLILGILSCLDAGTLEV